MHAEMHRDLNISDFLCNRWCFAHETKSPQIRKSDVSEYSSFLCQTISLSERAEILSASHPDFSSLF